MVVARVVALFLLLVSSDLWALRMIDVKQKWWSKIDHPTRAAICDASLWVYSRSRKEIVRLDPMSGKEIGAWAIQELVSAVTCKNSGVVLGLSDGGQAKIQIFKNGKFQENFKVPAGGSVRDLKCVDNLCLILRESGVAASSDLINWKSIAIPLSAEIRNEKVENKDNPFAFWNEEMLLAEGVYTRIVPLEENHFYLLDPIRNKIVSKNGSNLSKWGSWGGWEGHFLSPKAISKTNKLNILVADPGLKAVFLFTPQSEYIGVLSEAGRYLNLDYPFEVVVFKDMIFIVDVMANTVFGYSWKEPESPVETDETFRTNLFRRHTVLKDLNRGRCLKCHDGLVSDQFDKYFANFHPVECSSCHDPHHGTRNSAGEKNHPKFLRHSVEQLCLNCHKPSADRHDHPGKCTSCHSAHAMQDKILKFPLGGLCTQCHQPKSFKHRRLSDLNELDSTKRIHLSNGEITCLTCHAPHIQKAEKSKVELADKITKACQSCHGTKSKDLYSNFHKKMRGR